MESFQPKFLISTIVNGNEVKLYRQYYAGGKYSYFIHWGVPGDDGQSIQELLTPKGRPRSERGAVKEFLKAAKAAQYLKFDKL
jgi:hypothetical protein